MIFSSAHGIFSRIDHKQGYKLNLSKFKKTIISSIFFNHNTTRLGINYKKKNLCVVKNTNTWRLNGMLLNHQWITKEIREEIKQTPRNK